MGASPDGISNEYDIEVMCPTTEKTVKNYINNGLITEKYKAQVQMQMFFGEKKQALFCVANADFETSKKVDILTVDFDEQYCLEILGKSVVFWKNAIFPLLKKSLNYTKCSNVLLLLLFVLLSNKYCLIFHYKKFINALQCYIQEYIDV